MRERCNVVPGEGCMFTMNHHYCYCYCYCYDYVLSPRVPKGTCGGDVSAWPRIVRCLAGLQLPFDRSLGQPFKKTPPPHSVYLLLLSTSVLCPFKSLALPPSLTWIFSLSSIRTCPSARLAPLVILSTFLHRACLALI